MGLRRKKTLIEQASDYVDSVKPQIESAVASAKERTGTLLAEASEKAGPVIADARDKAGPALAAGAAVAAEKASVGASLAAEKAAHGRDLAAAKVAQLQGKPQPKKGGKLKKLLLLGGLAAAAGVLFKKLTGGQPTDNWQSSYVPTPAPVPVREADDSTGASPDEAVADATDVPHPVSTPDEPVETVIIDEDAAHKS